MSPRRQKGYIFLLMILALIGFSTAIGLVLLGHAPNFENTSQRNNLRALNAAKELLIAKALTEDNTPGSLPCPASTSSATSSSCSPEAAATLGRFPFKTLDSARITDDHGECLWYVLSPSFRNHLNSKIRTASNFNQAPINPGNAGNLILVRPDQTRQRAIAFLIAPRTRNGEVTPHTSDPVSGCNNFSVDSPLEILGPVKNGQDLEYSLPKNSDDMVIALTASDLYKPIMRVVLFAVRKATDLPPVPTTTTLQVLREQAPKNFDQTIFGASSTSETPSCPNDADREARGWLCWNDWYKFIQMQNPDTLVIDLPAADGSRFQCNLRYDGSRSTLNCSAPVEGSI